MSNDEGRLERMELTEIAKAATVRYGRAVDAKDLHRLRSDVFRDDIILRTPASEYRGIDDVVAFFAAAFEAEPGTRRHFVTNQLIDVRGAERIEIDSYFLFVSADARSVIGWGGYQDVVSVRGGEGRISEKTITLDVHTDLDTGWAQRPGSGGVT